jgi:DNA-binding NarL/FixJ family response regulator
VLVVDGQPVLRRGIRCVVDDQLGKSSCREANGMAGALEALDAEPFDLVITDAALEGGGGFELAKRIQASWPHTRVLFFTGHSDMLFAERALAAGARGYVMKHEGTDALGEAIRTVLEGRVFVSETVKKQFVLGIAGLRPPPSPLERLSDRELEVFEHLGRGLDRSEISRMLNLSVKTVESYRARIKQKLGLATAARLRRAAVQWLDETVLSASVPIDPLFEDDFATNGVDHTAREGAAQEVG